MAIFWTRDAPKCPLIPLLSLIRINESCFSHLLRYDKNAAGIQNPDGKDVLSITDKNIHLQSSGYAREITVPSGFYKELPPQLQLSIKQI